MSAVEQAFQEIEAWRDGKLWGCKSIANEAGVHPRTIIRWEKLPDCPITIVNGRYFVLRIDLMLWMTSKRPMLEAEDIAEAG